MWNFFGKIKRQNNLEGKGLNKTNWILCPVCGNKTRTMIREDTEMKNFPLYCSKCKKETIINSKDMKITLAVSK